MARTARTAPTFTADSLATFTTYADAYALYLDVKTDRDVARIDAMLEVDNLLAAKWTATDIAAGFLAHFGSHAAADFLPTQINRVMPFALTGRVFGALTDADADQAGLALGTYTDQYGNTAPVTVSRVAAVIEFLCNNGATKSAQQITGAKSSARAMVDALTAEYDALKSKKSGKKSAGNVVTLADALATMTATLEAAVAQLGELDGETADQAGLLGLALAEFNEKFNLAV